MSIDFNVVTGSVLLRKNGRFRVAQVFERNDELFAYYLGSYVRLMDHHQTSVPGLVWEELDVEPGYAVKMARLVVRYPQITHMPRKKKQKPTRRAS